MEIIDQAGGVGSFSIREVIHVRVAGPHVKEGHVAKTGLQIFKMAEGGKRAKRTSV